MVIYLAGLDHYIHEKGVSEGQRFFREPVDTGFDESLHDNINLIVRAVQEKIGDQATIFGTFVDHGLYDTDPNKLMGLATTGSVLEDRGFPNWRTVLTPDAKFRVSNRYADQADEPRESANVIFGALYSFLNVYVAGNIEDANTYDWTKPPPLADLELLVNQIVFSYIFGLDDGPSPIADLMVRVPSPEFPDDFDKSVYKMIRRDYDPTRIDCGPGGIGTGEDLCGLEHQLMTLEEYFAENLQMGEDSEFRWTFNNPVNRIRDWISTNTGDIVVFANAKEQFQFVPLGPANAQHGSLTYADSLVPIAFAYPGATGDATEDTTMQALREYMSQLPSVGVDGGQQVIQAIAEAEALRALFGLPAAIRPHGGGPP